MTTKLGALILLMLSNPTPLPGGRAVLPGPWSRLLAPPRMQFSGEELRRHFLASERQMLALIQWGRAELERQQREGHPAFRPEQLERVRQLEVEYRRRVEQLERQPVTPIPLRVRP
jgi:hypothetical protein